MNKAIKRLITSLLSITMVLSLTTSATAYFSSEKIINDDEVGYAETFDEADAKGILYDKPLTEKTKNELLDEGYLFYDDSNVKMPNTRATQTGVLGYVNGSGTYNVRVTPGGVGQIIGTVKQKDIVKVNSISGDFANVDFIAANGTTKTGYMLNSGIYTPAYNWVSPTGTSGYVSQHFGDTDTNSNGHTGVDIAGIYTTTNLKAVNDGTAHFKIGTVVSGNVTYYAEYGRLVFLDTTAGSNSRRVAYAHMSSFNGVDTPDYGTEGYPGFHLGAVYTELDSRNVSKGDILGKAGNSGLATGVHLHFEVRNSSGTRLDPFLYIVFPKITKS